MNESKNLPIINLSSAQLRSLKELIGDKQDFLFDRLQKVVAEKQDGRAEGLRESLRYWDAIYNEVANSAQLAFLNETA